MLLRVVTMSRQVTLVIEPSRRTSVVLGPTESPVEARRDGSRVLPPTGCRQASGGGLLGGVARVVL